MSIQRFPVEAGAVLIFARSIGDANPTYEALPDGAAVPPTFVQSGVHFDPDWPLRPKPAEQWFGSGADAAGPTGPPDGGGGLHAEQRFDYHRPLRCGDVLRAESRPGKSWQKDGNRGGRLHFEETVTEYFDEAGDPVVTATLVAVRTETAPKPGGQ